MDKIIFKIYIAGLNTRNSETIAMCKKACEEKYISIPYEIQVIDILTNTSSAEKKRILATPTIIVENGKDERRIIGELKDIMKAMQAIKFLTEDLTTSYKDE